MLPEINFPLEQPQKLCFIYIQTDFLETCYKW